MDIQQPTFLRKKDLVAITCPAGFMPGDKAQECIHTLQDWGYDVLVGKTLGSNSDNFFSGTDDERRDELQAMLDDENIKAIFFGRGGYGVSRIVDELDFRKFRKNPKWLIGFSDITVLHCHIYKRYKIASIHAQMAAAYNEGGADTTSVQSIHTMIRGKKNRYTLPAHHLNQTGKAEGILLGGNLTLLANITGTASEISTVNCILFLEDIGEYLYSVDRLLMQLKRAEKLSRIKGLIFGGFTDMKDTERKFGNSIEDILTTYIPSADIPVCYDFPVSHTSENHALKVGGNYSLHITKTRTILKEI